MIVGAVFPAPVSFEKFHKIQSKFKTTYLKTRNFSGLGGFVKNPQKFPTIRLTHFQPMLHFHTA